MNASRGEKFHMTSPGALHRITRSPVGHQAIQRAVRLGLSNKYLPSAVRMRIWSTKPCIAVLGEK